MQSFCTNINCNQFSAFHFLRQKNIKFCFVKGLFAPENGIRTMKVNIGQKLKIIREDRKMTQSEFAELLSMSTSAYNRLERGETSADMEQLMKIAETLKVPIQDLLPEVMNLHCHNQNSQGGIVMGNFINNYYGITEDKLIEENRQLKNELESLKQKMETIEKWFNEKNIL